MRTRMAIAALLAGVTMGANAAELTGTASYRERMALPAGALLEADLLDVSLADAPSVRLGRTRIAADRTPIDFAIPYDAAAIDPRHSYVVAARISLDGQVLFRTDTAFPVLTRGAGESVELLLVRSDEPARTAADLAGAWAVTEIGGAPVAAGVTTSLEFDAGRASGDGGCNRFGGGYEAEGAKIAFAQMAATLRACPDPAMAQEGAFFAALAETRGFRFEGEGLVLVDSAGTALVRLERP